MDIPSNAFELFNNYKSYYQKNERLPSPLIKTQTALIRCVVPALGGPKPKGNCSTSDELKAAMSFLESISLQEFLDSVEIVKKFMESENIPKPQKRERWTFLKKFINWATQQEYVSKQINKDLNLSGDNSTPRYALGCYPGDYITLELHNQLEDYRQFLIEERGLCDDSNSSVDFNLRTTKLLLGWLHREKNVPLDDLRLERIVPLLKTEPSSTDFMDSNGVLDKTAYLQAKRQLEKQARERSEATILLVKTFLDNYFNSLSRKLGILVAIINIAKFIYKNETNTKVAKNYEDIKIIELLREIRSDEVNNSKRVRSRYSELDKSRQVI